MAYPGGNAVGPMPVTMQPGGMPPQVMWMPCPQAPPNCPPGLEYLSQVDQLLIQQKVEVIEALIGYESNNRYEIKNSMGQRVYFAVEDTCCCTRNQCGSDRPFDINIIDNRGREVIHLDSPLRCDSCWCPCCLKKIEVEAPPGTTVGYVRQAWQCCSCRPEYKIQDANGDTVLRIKGPCITCNMCMGDVVFDIFTEEGDHPVGQIRKNWSGVLREVFTDSDNFGVTFPIDLDVGIKATVLAAVFMIDFMHFEESRKDGDKGLLM